MAKPGGGKQNAWEKLLNKERKIGSIIGTKGTTLRGPFSSDKACTTKPHKVEGGSKLELVGTCADHRGGPDVPGIEGGGKRRVIGCAMHPTGRTMTKNSGFAGLGAKVHLGEKAGLRD